MNLQLFNAYWQLCRLHKPIPILLLIWPLCWALWIAAVGMPDIGILLIFIAGAILMRTVGCIINDLTDRKLDIKVARTRIRPLATGIVSVKGAIALFIILSLIAFALVLLLNTKTIILAIMVMPLVIAYPWMKRITFWPQLFLGIVYNWGILMAFTAVTNAWPPMIAWLLYLMTIIWTIAYDTMYAMVDREDDLQIGIKSTAVLFGEHDKTIIALFQALVIIGLITIGRYLQTDIIYYICIAIAALLAIYQQYLLQERIREKCMQAFLNNLWFGLVIFLGILWQY